MKLELIGHPWRGGGYVGIRVENSVFSVLAGQQGVRAEPLPHLWRVGAGLLCSSLQQEEEEWLHRLAWGQVWGQGGQRLEALQGSEGWGSL